MPAHCSNDTVTPAPLQRMITRSNTAESQHTPRPTIGPAAAAVAPAISQSPSTAPPETAANRWAHENMRLLVEAVLAAASCVGFTDSSKGG